MKKCQFCAEAIQDAAVVCKHCGRNVPTGGSRPSAAAAALPSSGVAFLLGLLMILLGFLFQRESELFWVPLLIGFLAVWLGRALSAKGSTLVRYGGGFLLACVALVPLYAMARLMGARTSSQQPSEDRAVLPRVPGKAAPIVTKAKVEPTTSEAENPRQTEALRTYMKENFGLPGFETSWYGSITSASVRGTTAVLSTNLTAGDTRAQGVCSGASGYIFSNQNRGLGIASVRVVGANGADLIHRRGINGRCS